MGRRAAFVTVAAFCVALPLGAVVTASASTTVARPATISRDQAVAAALAQLPGHGAGYQVLKTELEPDSRHFTFTGIDGSGFGQDSVEQCLIIPPLPVRFACRPFPVWVVEVRSTSCNATIAINGYSGRFGGAGTDSCEIVPVESPAPWFVPSWE